MSKKGELWEYSFSHILAKDRPDEADMFLADDFAAGVVEKINGISDFAGISPSRDNVREFTGICIKCGACIKKCPMQAKYYENEALRSLQ